MPTVSEILIKVRLQAQRVGERDDHLPCLTRYNVHITAGCFLSSQQNNSHFSGQIYVRVRSGVFYGMLLLAINMLFPELYCYELLLPEQFADSPLPTVQQLITAELSLLDLARTSCKALLPLHSGKH